MTSPPEKRTALCPRCGTEVTGYIRASINLSLGEVWTPADIREVTTLLCGECGHRLAPRATLVVEFEDRVLPEEVPVLVRPCAHCGSREAPVTLKPKPGSAEWWDDPGSYLGCPECGGFASSLPVG